MNQKKIKKKEEHLNAKEPNTDIQGRQKTDKEEIKKEKSTLDNNNQNIQKNDKDKKLYTSTSSKTHNYENNLKVNKNKIIKKGSQRVQHAMNELKLLSLKEIDNDKKKFFP